MTDLNMTALGGRLTKDVVVEKIKETTLARGSIAVNRSRWNIETQQNVNKVTFVDFVIFGIYAEKMVKYLKKGTYVTAEGYLDQDSWTTDDGKNHKRLKFVVEQGKLNPWVSGKKESEKIEEPVADAVSKAEADSFDNPENFDIY